MSFNLAFGPIDIFQGLDLNAFNEYLASLKPNQPIDEYTGILEPERPVTDGISGGYGIDNKPPVDERPNAPIGIPIEHFIAGITGKPVLGPDGNIIEPTFGDTTEVGGPVVAPPPEVISGILPNPDSPEVGGIETLPAAPTEPGQGIASLNNSMMFERMKSLARQPRDYRSYIG